MKKGIVLKLLGITSGVLFSFVLAQSAFAISISPVKFELSANPGDELRNVLRVYNDTAEAVVVSINIDNFSPTGEGGQVVIDEESPDSGFSLKSWVEIVESQFTLEPRTSKAFEFVVRVPANAEPGGHYGSILASLAPATTGGGALSITQRVGALLLLDVSGEVTEKMYVAEFAAPNFSEYGPVELTLRFKNDGSIHLKPRGFVTITNMFGKEVGTVDVPQSNILPQSIRKFDLSWGEKYLYGKYTAKLSAIYGSGNEALTSVTEFWVIPWKLLGVAALLLLLILIVLIRGRRRIALALRVLKGGELPLQ